MITKTDVIKIAKLARMSLSDKEITSFQDDLSKILSFVNSLADIDVALIKPMSHAGQVSLPLREDISQESLGRECFISSMGYEDGLVKVPKIIE